MRVLKLTRSAVDGGEDGGGNKPVDGIIWGQFNSKSMVNGLRREGGRKGRIYCRNVDALVIHQSSNPVKSIKHTEIETQWVHTVRLMFLLPAVNDSDPCIDSKGHFVMLLIESTKCKPHCNI